MKNRAIILITILSLLLTGCGKDNKPNSALEEYTLVEKSTPIPKPSKMPTPTDFPSDIIPAPDDSSNQQETDPAITEAPTEEPTPTEEPVPTVDPVFDPNYNADLVVGENMYLNQANAFPIIFTQFAEIQFSDSDIITIIAEDSTVTELHLSETVHIEGTDTSDSELWYFCNAFRKDNRIYAHYDYLNGKTETPSLLIMIDTDSDDFTPACCISSVNPRLHFNDDFLLIDERIYYTKTVYPSSGAITSIYSAALDGTDEKVLYNGKSGDRIIEFATDGTDIFIIVNDIDYAKHLYRIDLAKRKASVLKSNLSSYDFMVAWNGFAFIPVNNVLYWYDATGKQYSYRMAGDSTSVGYPVSDGIKLYFPQFDLIYNNGTVLVEIDPNTSNTAIYNISDTFYRTAGMIGTKAYFEDYDSYYVVDMTEIAPVAIPVQE